MDRDTSIVTQVSAKIAAELASTAYTAGGAAVELPELFENIFARITPTIQEACGVEVIAKAFPGAEIVTGGVIGAPNTTYPTGQFQPVPTHVDPQPSQLVHHTGPQNIPGVEDGDPEVAALWNEYFQDPSKWWDNRKDKRNPRGPDFKQKDDGRALWIVDKKAPSWVRVRLNQVA